MCRVALSLTVSMPAPGSPCAASQGARPTSGEEPQQVPRLRLGMRMMRVRSTYGVGTIEPEHSDASERTATLSRDEVIAETVARAHLLKR